MGASSKAPVKYRYSVLNPLISDSLDIVRLLYEASAIKEGEGAVLLGLKVHREG